MQPDENQTQETVHLNFTGSLLALSESLLRGGRGPAPAEAAAPESVPVEKVRPHRSSLLPLVLTLATSLLLPGSVEAQAIRDLPGFKARTVARNDDGSSSFVSLPFPINFFGRLRGGCWVNNNGNITFDRSLSTFTPFGLDNTQTEIIAPFFADVDTRGQRSQLVSYGEDTVNGRLAFGANYINVGYFASHDEKLNSFQVILIDRSDTGSGNFDVEFNYARIVWETGDASGGASGFGGVPAAVGWSNGSGQPGTSFQLPGSLVVGAFLDNGPLALARRRLNSPVVGRYLFRARDGQLSPGLAITSGNLLSNARLGNPYTATLEATGGSNYRWSLLLDPGQTLPGLTLSPSGVLSGIPTAVGTYNFTATVTSRVEGTEESVSQRLTLVVLPASLEILSRSCPLPDGNVGVDYRQPLRVTGGPGPYLWSWGQNGVSPVPGLTLSEDGTISGTPTRGGSYNFLLRVAGNPNAAVEPAVQSCSLTVRQAFTQLTVASCPSEWGTEGVPYEEMVRAGGGVAPYRWTAIGALPPGVRLGETGLMSGIPGATGRFVYGLEATDRQGRSSRVSCSITVGSPGIRIESACPLPTSETGQRVGVSLVADGGTAPYRWSSVGTLPPGLTLRETGELSGSANDGGSFQFLLIARDQNGLSAAKPCALSVVRAPLSIAACPLPPGHLGQNYDADLPLVGGVAPFVWSLGGRAPEGLTLLSTGKLSGTPRSPGLSSFTLSVRDGNGRTATQQCEFFVEPKPLRLLGDCPLSAATVGSFYRAHALPDGGVSPYRFSLEGRAPAGLTLGEDGWLSGTPASAGMAELTFILEDARRASVRRTCTLELKLPALPDVRVVGAPATIAPASGTIPVAVQLDRAYPLPIRGSISLIVTADTGAPGAVANRTDPAVVFAANGRQNLSFTIPAGSRRVATTIASAGTVAGTILAKIDELRIAGSTLAAPPGAAVITMQRTVPLLSDACYSLTGGALNLRLTGVSNTREVTGIKAVLNGRELQELSATATAADYFSGDLSIRTGGAFQFEVALPVEATTAAPQVESLRVSLQNRLGFSAERIARACN